MMCENLIESKAKAFALRVIKLYKYLQRKREPVMCKQVLRESPRSGRLDGDELMRLLVASIKTGKRNA